MGCHKVKYFFFWKVFFLPFQKTYSFPCCCRQLLRYDCLLEQGIFCCFGPGRNELIIKKQHCCLWTCENLHDCTKGSAATKHRSTLNTDRRVVRRGSTAPAASFTIVQAPNTHSTTTIDKSFFSQTASIINILKHCIFQVHFPLFHAIITWQYLRHGRPKCFLNPLTPERAFWRASK